MFEIVSKFQIIGSCCLDHSEKSSIVSVLAISGVNLLFCFPEYQEKLKSPIVLCGSLKLYRDVDF